jgi:hypothetical protein
MKKLPFLVLMFIVLILAPACKTVSLKDIKNIPIPEGLTNRQAIGGVILSTEANKMPQQWTIDDKILEKATSLVVQIPAGVPIERRRVPLFGHYYEDGKWRIEEARDDYAVLGYSVGKCYARVKYQVKGNELVPEVISSDNLIQSKNRIHKNGVMWINRNIPVIREGMWQVSRIQLESMDKDASKKTLKKELEDEFKKDAASKPK